MVSPSLPPPAPSNHSSALPSVVQGLLPEVEREKQLAHEICFQDLHYMGRRRYRAIDYAIQSMYEKIKAAQPHAQVYLATKHVGEILVGLRTLDHSIITAVLEKLYNGDLKVRKDHWTRGKRRHKSISQPLSSAAAAFAAHISLERVGPRPLFPSPRTTHRRFYRQRRCPIRTAFAAFPWLQLWPRNLSALLFLRCDRNRAPCFPSPASQLPGQRRPSLPLSPPSSLLPAHSITAARLPAATPVLLLLRTPVATTVAATAQSATTPLAAQPATVDSCFPLQPQPRQRHRSRPPTAHAAGSRFLNPGYATAAALWQRMQQLQQGRPPIPLLNPLARQEGPSSPPCSASAVTETGQLTGCPCSQF
ncbi:hypothetical protein C4D60_Mb04t04550 [Musa balbisiana]|uniref:Uncharacterized protein n=1 Tax=Musa balbisiana TaxID=52838 RepID=A0A4S8K9P4_MUSBA|nr:hypothetical protein C4D60_Mb04t04550 [Musa balbisiana]